MDPEPESEVLCALARDIQRRGSDLDQGLGKDQNGLRQGTDFDDGVDTVGWPRWRVASVRAVQADHLSADQGPTVAENVRARP